MDRSTPGVDGDLAGNKTAEPGVVPPYREGYGFAVSGWIGASVADLVEGAFDELFALIADLVNGGHGFDDAGGRSCEGKLAVGYLALIQRERAIAKDHEAAVGEFAAIVLVEIEDDFFVGEFVIADFHRVSGWVLKFFFEKTCRIRHGVAYSKRSDRRVAISLAARRPIHGKFPEIRLSS
jgi:hypothetical protein